MNKLIPMILFFLESGKQPRHKVTAKIKNYPKETRDNAIEYVVNERLVRLFEESSSSGRTPVSVELTEKGRERVLELSRVPRHNSVWGALT